MQVEMLKKIVYNHPKLRRRVRTRHFHLIITSLRVVITIKIAREAKRA